MMDLSSILSMFGGGGSPQGAPQGGPDMSSIYPGIDPSLLPQQGGQDVQGVGAPSFGGMLSHALSGATGDGDQRFRHGLSAANPQPAPQIGMGHMLRMLMPDLFGGGQ
jgi:hypothetical protein